MTEYGLAFWLAQTCKLDLSAMPNLKPPHISATAFDDLRAMIKDQMLVKDKPPQTAEMHMIQTLLKLVQKEQLQMPFADQFANEKHAQY